MPNKEFLENYPLYKKFRSQWDREGFESLQKTYTNLPQPAIHMHCDVCESEQTFNMVNEYYENHYFNLEQYNEKFQVLDRRKK
jgi:hypothetical protein